MTNKNLSVIFKGLATAAVSAVLAVAQVNQSNLTGVVEDSSGAAVTGASIQLTNIGTGESFTQKSDKTGLYRFISLNYGNYRLEVENAGFKKFVREPIELSTGQTTTVDVTLTVGEQRQTVEVKFESPLLRTETGSLGSTISTKMLDDLPMIGRNPYVLLKLSPGITYYTDTENIHAYDNHGSSEFDSNGSASVSEFLLDGIPNMRIDMAGFIPSPDATDQMRAQTNAYDAEYGHTGAAFVNASTRTGTNQIHGTAYWYLRNNVLNANDFFNNLNGVAKGAFRQNTYGASIAGPVQIPKIYNGKNRTFYFFNFEGLRLRETDESRAIVPTTLERNGDFSQTTDVKGRPYTIYDPATTRPNGSGYIRSPFPGNIVPGNRMDTVAIHTLAYYPLPNLARTSTSQQNFQTPQINGTDWSSLLGRVDYSLTDMQKLFVRFGWNSRFDPSTPAYGANCCAAAGNANGTDEFRRGDITGAVGYTWMMSPGTVVDVRMGLTRYNDGDYLFGDNFNIAQLGFAPSFVNSVAHDVFPRFVMSDDLDSLGPNSNVDRTKIVQYNPGITIHTEIGRHALKYGFEYQVAQENLINFSRPTGKFTFDRTFTQGPDPTKSATNDGDDLASFLLGDVTSAYANIQANPALENKYYDGYIQDDWKVTGRLTLNLGLRLEHESALTERFNRLNAGFNPTVSDPLAAQAEANYAAHPIPQLASLNVQGGMQFVGVNGAPRGAFDTETLNFAPRFGFATRLTNFMVWRGGFGLYYVPNNLANYAMDGFSTQTNMVTSLDGNLTPYNTLSNPFPNGQTQPVGAAGGLLTDIGHSMTEGVIASGALPAFKNGLSEQFSTGFQFVLPARVSIETSYVGNVSQRLTITRNINQYSNQYLALRTGLNAKVPNPFYGVITDPTSSLSASTITVAQLLSPYPQYTGFTEALLPYGRSNYNSLQVDVKKRTAKGLSFGAAYTFSKYMEAVTYLNANDAAPAHVVSSADHPQILTLYGTYELPFGPGKPFLSGSNPVVKQIVGGWQASWFGTLQSGSPLSFSGAERTSRSNANPNTIAEWFDINQFVVHQAFTLTQLSPRVADLLSPGIAIWDLTALKSFSITEGLKLTFKSEFYNAFTTRNSLRLTRRSLVPISGASPVRRVSRVRSS